jgi:hypothetical protein
LLGTEQEYRFQGMPLDLMDHPLDDLTGTFDHLHDGQQ